MRQSHTAVIARNETWSGAVETEPFEVAWANEAILFLRVLASSTLPLDAYVSIQISPDGLHWCDEGATLKFNPDSSVPTFVRLRHFGGWLRIVGTLPQGTTAKVILYFALKS